MPFCQPSSLQRVGQRFETRLILRFGEFFQTGTIFAGHHQPLRVWMLCLYFVGLNLANELIAHELDLNGDDAQKLRPFGRC